MCCFAALPTQRLWRVRVGFLTFRPSGLPRLLVSGFRASEALACGQRALLRRTLRIRAKCGSLVVRAPGVSRLTVTSLTPSRQGRADLLKPWPQALCFEPGTLFGGRAPPPRLKALVAFSGTKLLFSVAPPITRFRRAKSRLDNSS